MSLNFFTIPTRIPLEKIRAMKVFLIILLFIIGDIVDFVLFVRRQVFLDVYGLRIRDYLGPIVTIKRPLPCDASASFWPVSSV